MTGTGPFGPIEMGGMFTTLKVRRGLGANDDKDPGWYAHPEGTVAHEWTGDAAAAAPAPRQTAPGQAPGTPSVRKPGGGAHSHH